MAHARHAWPVQARTNGLTGGRSHGRPCCLTSPHCIASLGHNNRVCGCSGGIHVLACLAGSSLASLPAQVNNADHPPQLVVAPCGVQG